MTNLEKYEDKIKLIIYSGNGFAITESDGKVAVCGIVNCNDCKFYKSTMSCRIQREKWLQKKYEERKEPKVDWSKVEIDTPILVSNDDENWYKRYFAKYNSERNVIYAFDRGCTSWSADRTAAWDYAKLAKQEKK